ncbi:MAG: hypothetical protein F6K19_46915 [Cyanothece sp. SIO1E1]|nr:hypothetical protein [Cyanothece sp. SIO1E1]
MIDPGHPFANAYRFEELIQSLQDQFRQGVEQPAQKSFVFQGETSYELPEIVHKIETVRESKLTNPRTFIQNQDYRLSNNRLLWLQPPPEGTRIWISYTYRSNPSGLTDFNPGSVVGTLVRALARELKLLYGQMDEAYRRAFIDTATGVALDNVVSLLAVERKQAEPARGHVTFRRTDTTNTVLIPANTRLADENGREFVTTQAQEFPAGEVSLRVAIEATEPGPAGNVPANTIVIMPTPLPELGSVTLTNEEALRGGQAPESDEQLRERTKFQLERSGNATLNAIKYAALELEGIDEVEVIDHSVDSTVPLGEIRVRYSSDDDTPALRQRVEAVVEATRAAGILAQVRGIDRILVSGTFYVIPEPAVPEGATHTFQTQVERFINALVIGEPLSLRRLNALIYDIAGLADVAEAQLTHNRAAGSGAIADPFLTQPTELLRSESLDVMLLAGFEVAASRRVGNTNELDIQLVDRPDSPITWRNLSIDISLLLLASLRLAPDQPPERIATITRTVQFTDTDGATIIIADADVLSTPERGSGFRPDDHNPAVAVTLRAAAYPGLAAATSTITLPATS